MTYAVLLYHRQPELIYKDRWISDCLDSIRYQTFNDFEVLEWDYSGEGFQLYPKSIFFCSKVPTFVDALNSLMNNARDQEYDGAFNVHIDDFYDVFRFEKQVAAIERGYDLVSSNFFQVDGENQIEHTFTFHHLDPKEQLLKRHNIICNPVVAFSKRWLAEAYRCDPSKIPHEDMACWIRNMDEMRMRVLPQYLCSKRFHYNEASNSENR